MTMIANIFMEECKKLTPEDTKEMLNSYKISEIKREWDAYIVIISNTAKHAIYVEYGIRGLTYNYHKPKGSVFYSWVGNRTMARAMDNKRDEMLKVLQSILW